MSGPSGNCSCSTLSSNINGGWSNCNSPPDPTTASLRPPTPCSPLWSWGCPCGVGKGRTGTFVALSRLLQQLEEEQMVDVFHAVYALRMHQPLMIQTLSQYVFLHSCLLNKILEGPFNISESWPISVTDLPQACAKRAASANAGFLKEYELLLQAIKDEAGSSAPPPGYEQDSPVSYDRSQGQFSPVEESPPDDMPEAWLFPGGPSGRDHTVLTGPAGPKELWELVWQHRAHVLVSLCPPNVMEKP
ncbi:receptor-type tyrosine-protein phosphatase V-like [Pan paniscus]|uniref:receptor-type tyrosine-protein phosphatase V-like n=1 Tax=Pan paniscus TaxID=9597 RepID=UPI0002742F63|nr:receptor-type tyrosine-protein phosphatase V-like [Pan paniscus]